jgi:Ca2+-binding EF-hand superfamily protein
VEVPDLKLQTLFDEHDMDKSGTIEYEEFLKLVK